MYGYNNFGNSYNPQIPQRPIYMPQNPTQDMEQGSPFQVVKFVNEKEAQGYVLLPNQKALLMDTANMKFWIKWTDSLGNSSIETYKFEKSENNNFSEHVQSFNTSDFLKKDDLKNIATKSELDLLKDSIEELKKQIKINQILSEKPSTITKGD